MSLGYLAEDTKAESQRSSKPSAGRKTVSCELAGILVLGRGLRVHTAVVDDLLSFWGFFKLNKC